MHSTNNGHAYVYADIDNVSQYPMVIDTGANRGILPHSVKKRLDLRNKKIESQMVTGGTGEMELEFITIDNTKIGGEVQNKISYLFQDLDKLSSESNQVPGIIGHNFLVDYCVEFDFTKQLFSLTKSECDVKETQGLRALPFKIRDEFIWAKANFNGTQADVLLDTGAHHSFINSALLKHLGEVETGQQENFSALTSHEQSRTELHNIEYKLGEHKVKEEKMYAADMHVFSVLGFKNKPFLLLGLDYFKAGKLIIDYANQRMYF